MIDLTKEPFCLNKSDIDWVETMKAQMTLEEKVGQLFMACVYSIEEIEELQKIIPISGVMFRPIPIETCCEITNVLKKSRIPMLIAADLERGATMLLPDGTKFGYEMEIAATRNTKHAEHLAAVCGKEGKAVGINWAFAPVADVDLNFRNPMTNIRTFGSDASVVEEMSATYINTIQQYGMAATAKHFPGDGVDERDHHLVTPVNSLSKSEWDASYGKIYKRCIDEGVLTIMVGHIIQPAITRYYNPEIADEDMLPASLSSELMQNCLRDELGFNGLIVTDATTMSGFTIPMPRSKSVPLAIARGADIFLFSRNMREDVQFMLDGIKAGILTEERLDEAVTRILALKAKLGLHKDDDCKEYDPESARLQIGLEEHREWARECAKEAITLVKEEKGILPISPQKYPRVLFYSLQNDAAKPAPGQINPCDRFEELLKKEGFIVERFSPLSGKEGKVTATQEFVKKYDLILYMADYMTQSGQTTVRINWEQPLGANCPHFITSIPTIFISVANPYHLMDVPRVRTFINAYSPYEEAVDEIVEKLMGRDSFVGRSPVDPFCGKWDTHL